MGTSAFAWLSSLVEWFGQFFPRWIILETTMGGVKFVRGNKLVPLVPGIHWYWPAVTRVTLYPCVNQTDELRSQTIVTTDDRTIDVSGLLRYDVPNPTILLSQNYDGKIAIADVSLTAIHDVCCRLSWEELKTEQRRGTLKTKLKNAARKELEDMGVRVLEMTLTDMAICRVLKVKQSMRSDGEV